jgi:ABC-2 type transport system ATP-binding protein
MIKVHNLNKRYGSVQALKNLSFEVKKGEILGFLGPNGAGKTTTMKIITGFFPPTEGSVEICGLSLEKHQIECKRKIGYLPENVPLYHDMKMMDFFDFVARVKGVPRKVYKSQINQILEECSLSKMKTRVIGTLSKGFRQRVGLAQALIGDPEILILDEPTIGLDPKQIIEIRSLIKKMAGIKTVILCTHILPEVSMVCDRVVIINEGAIVAIDTPDNLNLQLKKKNEILLSVSGPVESVYKVLRPITHLVDVKLDKSYQGFNEYCITTDIDSDIRHEIADAIISSNESLRFLEMRTVTLSLEDIFLRLVTNEQGVEAHA